MSELTLNLSDYKASGVYFEEIDNTQTTLTRETVARMAIGFNKKGPFNRPIYFAGSDDCDSFLGPIDRKIERKGCFTNRNIRAMVRKAPVYGLSLLPVNTADVKTNKDLVGFSALSFDWNQNNIDGKTIYAGMYDRTKFWIADDVAMVNSVNAELTSGAHSGWDEAPVKSDALHCPIFSIGNCGTKDMSIIVRKAEGIKGYDVTFLDWYGSVDAIPYAWINPYDYVKDYFVQVIAISGNWSKEQYSQLANDPVWGEYFTATGIKREKVNKFIRSGFATVLGNWTGCILPDFIDGKGNNVSISYQMNRVCNKTGVMWGINSNTLDELNFGKVQIGNLEGEDVKENLVYGYYLNSDVIDETEEGYPVVSNLYEFPIDILGFNVNTPSDHLSYAFGGEIPEVKDTHKVYYNPESLNKFIEFEDDIEEDVLVVGDLADGEDGRPYRIVKRNYREVLEGDSDIATSWDTNVEYQEYVGNFTELTNGDSAAEFDGNITKLNEIFLIFEGNKTEFQTAAEGGTLLTDKRYVLIPRSNDNVDDAHPDYHHFMVWNGTSWYDGGCLVDQLRYKVAAGNKKSNDTDPKAAKWEDDTTKFSTANGELIPDRDVNYILKPVNEKDPDYNHSAIYVDGAWVKSEEVLYKYYYEYSALGALKFEAAGEETYTIGGVEGYKRGILTHTNPIENLYEYLALIPIQGLKIGARHMPGYDSDGKPDMEAGVEKFYKMLSADIDESTGKIIGDEGLRAGLLNEDALDFRYLVDTFAGGLGDKMKSKKYLGELAKKRGHCTALLNAPALSQFAASTNPLFRDFDIASQTPGNFNVKYIPDGGNQDVSQLNTEWFTLPDEDHGSDFCGIFSPFLKYSEGTSTILVPPAADVSNTFMNKLMGGPTYAVMANTDGILSNPDMIGVEYEYSKEDRAYLEPFGFNCIINRGGRIMIYGDNTAFQLVKSDLNYLHTRETLNTLEINCKAILDDYVFKYNIAKTRNEIATRLVPILDSAIDSGAIVKYELQIDEANNTQDVINADVCIVDIGVWVSHAMRIMLGRITLNRMNS